ncbi:MAG: hypothetical protein Gyms2KO_31110 [Gymnodinialimonas sp.]
MGVTYISRPFARQVLGRPREAELRQAAERCEDVRRGGRMRGCGFEAQEAAKHGGGSGDEGAMSWAQHAPCPPRPKGRVSLPATVLLRKEKAHTAQAVWAFIVRAPSWVAAPVYYAGIAMPCCFLYADVSMPC